MPARLLAHPTEPRHLLLWIAANPGLPLPGAVEWKSGATSLGEPINGASVSGNGIAYGSAGTALTFYTDNAQILIGYAQAGQPWAMASLGSTMSPPPQFGSGGYPPRNFAASTSGPERVYAFSDKDLFDVSALTMPLGWKRYGVKTALGESVTWILPAASGSFYAAGKSMVKTCTLAATVTCGAASTGITAGDVPVRMFISPASASTIYLSASPGGASTYRGSVLYKSTDSGAHFTPVSINPSASGRDITDVILHPSDANVVAVTVSQGGGGTSDLFLSKNAAGSFDKLLLPADVGGAEAATIDADGTIFISSSHLYSLHP